MLSWARGCGMPWVGNVLGFAAREGSLEAVEYAASEQRWSLQEGQPVYFTLTPCTDTARAAATGGHVHILEWLQRRGTIKWDPTICGAAAAAGQLDALKWLRLQGYPWDKMTTAWGAVGGHTALVAWARENGCDFSQDTVLRLRLAQMRL